MKRVKSNLLVLVAQKSQRDGKRVTLRGIARDTGISTYTIYAMANNELNEYPKEVLEKLCTYFDCGVGELLRVEDVPEEAPDAA
jgi:DNA-binding Xre family transcriptional regulator